MKKLAFLLFSVFILSSPVLAKESTQSFEAEGEVVTVDPVYQRITIRHEVIPGFGEGAETEFIVSKKDLLEGLSRHDLVKFTIVDKKGDTRIEKIEKVGQAAPEDDRLKIGQAAQDALVATGEVAKGIVSPIAPAHTVVSGVVDSTTGATEEVLPEASPEVKKKF